MSDSTVRDRWTVCLALSIVLLLLGLYGNFVFPLPFLVFSSVPYEEIQAQDLAPREYLRVGLSGGPIIVAMLENMGFGRMFWDAPLTMSPDWIRRFAYAVGPASWAATITGLVLAGTALVANVRVTRPRLLDSERVVNGAVTLGGIVGLLTLFVLVWLQGLLTLQFAVHAFVGMVVVALAVFALIVVTGSSVSGGRRGR